MKLRILATTDLHMRLMPPSNGARIASAQSGLSRLADVIHEARKSAANCLLFDNGDTFEGSLIAEIEARSNNGAPHVMVAALNQLGVDAATLGNHDFDFGADALVRVLKQARYPVVLSNPSDVIQLTPTLQRSALLRRRVLDEAGHTHDLRIGVIGLAPPDSSVVTRAGQINVATSPDLRAAAKAAARDLHALNADLIVLLLHGGETHAQDPDLFAIIEAAKADAVIMGHKHALFPDPDDGPTGGPQTIAGVPAVMPGFWASHLGVIDLSLERDRNTWRVVAGQAHLRPNDDTPHAPISPVGKEIVRLSRAAHARSDAELRTVVAKTDIPLHSYFAGTRCSPCATLVAKAQCDWARAALDGTPWSGLPVIGVATDQKAGGWGGADNYIRILDGEVRESHLYDLCAYQNRTTLCLASGADVLDLLTTSAAVFAAGCQTGPDQAAPLFAPDQRIYDFLSLLGLSYRINLDGPAPRITDLRHRGNLVQSRDRFVIATSDYHARSINKSGLVPPDRQPLIRDVTRNWLQVVGPVTDQDIPEIWRFESGHGKRVWFDTHPDAENRLRELTVAAPRIEGLQTSGFLRISFEI